MLRRLATSKKPLIIVPVVLALVLAWLFLPVMKVSIEPYGRLSLESKITITIGYEAAYASSGWVSPTGFVDPGTEWTGETNAYDEDTGTYAVNTIPIPSGSWSNYLELTIDAINCDKVRYYFGGTDIANINCEIDVYYAGGWVNIFAGPPTFNAWTEVSLGSTQSVTSARMNFYNSHPNKSREPWVCEFDFNDVSLIPDISNTPTSKDFGTVLASTDYWSNGSAPTFPLDDTECYFTVTNNSSAAVDIDIRATNFTGGGGWTLAGTPAGDTVTLKAGKSGDALETDMVTLTTSDQAFITALGASLSKKWELKMETPISFSDGDTKTATVTLTATFP